ncbi:MAG: hypothetical protein H0V66_09195 [Bdellovibrionales bacterium]|nr:hypothetical protein [Bdellovibrionales bacterium]
MVWISLFLFSLNIFAKELPKFLTKHTSESIRYITLDGRYAYIQKRQGVLGMVSSFRSVDFISDESHSNFLVKDSRFKQRLAVEIIPNDQKEFNLTKNHKIMVVEWGKTQTREVGIGRASKLHLGDEWISYYDAIQKMISVQNILTQKVFQIKLSAQTSPYFTPEVEMISADTIIYSDVNDKGYIALIQYNLITQKSVVLYKSSQNGTRLELCQEKGYVGIGEFPYDDIARTSKILQIKLSDSTNLAGYTTIYSSTDSDLGNMVCLENSIYFIKTMTHEKKINVKQTEAVKLDLKTTQVQTVTDLGSVSQLLAMDGRILIPHRGDYYVLEGSANLTDDKLKSPLPSSEELPIDL